MRKARKKAKPHVLPMRDIRHSLPMALLKARETTMEQFRPLLKESGFTEQQWRVIRVLAETGTTEASVIAERAMLLAPSLSRILQFLERENIIERSPVSTDQRRSEISLTELGWQSFYRAAPASEAAYQEIEKRIGKAKLQKLFQLLEELDSALME